MIRNAFIYAGILPPKPLKDQDPEVNELSHLLGQINLDNQRLDQEEEEVLMDAIEINDDLLNLINYQMLVVTLTYRIFLTWDLLKILIVMMMMMIIYFQISFKK